jgi:hypothetical protein
VQRERGTLLQEPFHGEERESGVVGMADEVGETVREVAVTQ